MSDKLLDKLDQLYIKIKSQAKSHNYMDDFLEYLQNYQDSQKSLYDKNEIIKKMVDEFISYNMIYYNKTSKIYYNYIDDNYLLLNEDNMIHHVSYFITNFKNQNTDLSLKASIKQKIMKSIRDNNIYETIPDTNTIQTVLNTLVPNIFDKKEYVKIFLIVIGNMLMKKLQSKTIMFVRPQMKYFLNEINKYICMYFCNHNIFNVFKYKYTQDHASNEDIEKWLMPSKPINTDIFHFTEQFYVNMICVCIYYANRYESIDNYLESVIEDTTIIEEKVKYFQICKKEYILQSFVSKYLIEAPQEKMEQNDILFLWKQYVEENDLYVHLFTSYTDFLISLFSQCNQVYEEQSTCFNGYYSMDIPIIKRFREFWDNHFEYDENEYYFEISEILHLYHKQTNQKKSKLTEPTILWILQLYYNTYAINQNKVIHNLKCKLWDKKKEIDEFITKENINIKENVHHLYKKYCAYQKNLKISKTYFTTYMEKLKTDF
jgi:hypothetical protein